MKNTTLPKTFQPHHYRHLISGCVVFALSALADVYVAETYRRMASPSPKPHIVIWQSTTTPEPFSYYTLSSPPTNKNAEFGMLEDGTIVWRVK